MAVYLDLVMGLNFLVDFLLLLGTNRIAGYPAGPGRAAAAAVLGGVYGGACLLPGFRFLGNIVWRMVSLGLIGAIAFGLGRSTLRRCVLFVLLSMALGGIAVSIGSGGIGSLAGAAAGVAGLCFAGFQGKSVGRQYIPVELEHEGRRVCFNALVDTGNTLRDPLTGEPVLVAGAQIAAGLANLSPGELKDPAGTLLKRSGLRLVPYRAVGTGQGMLLAMNIRRGRIGNRERSVLVAFAPEGLGQAGEFEALIGGA